MTLALMELQGKFSRNFDNRSHVSLVTWQSYQPVSANNCCDSSWFILVPLRQSM